MFVVWQYIRYILCMQKIKEEKKQVAAIAFKDLCGHWVSMDINFGFI